MIRPLNNAALGPADRNCLRARRQTQNPPRAAATAAEALVERELETAHLQRAAAPTCRSPMDGGVHSGGSISVEKDDLRQRGVRAGERNRSRRRRESRPDHARVRRRREAAWAS
jgi:hypothetical protein